MADPLPTIVVGLFAIFFAALTQALTGFGFNLVSVPIMLIVLAPTTLVPIVMIYAGLVTMVILFEARKWVDIRRIWPLMIAGAISAPVGAYLLRILDVTVLKIVIGSVIVLFGAAFLRGFQRQIENERLAMAPVGLISGLLGGSTGMSGPPVILFLTNQGVTKQAFRANLALYFTLLSVVAVCAYGFGGLITRPVIHYTMLFLPAMIVGAIAGIKLAHRIEEELFRRIALVIVTLAGVFSIVSGLRGL